jgi:endonuclease/exonuclease/phosphatase family metal-dependent hydrolase
MLARRLSVSVHRSARWFPRIAASLALSVALVSCGKKEGTPDWNAPGGEAPNVSSPTPAAAPAAAPEAAPVAAPVAEPAELAPVSSIVGETAPPAPASRGSLRFIAYNVENWLTMDRYVDNQLLRDKPKPDSEKQAVVRLLSAHKPDVIGLCEIGTAADLADIQESLKASGLDFPHSHYVGGTDPVRHLGLLSRFPILSTAKPAETEFRLSGRTFGINRGILDATIGVHGKPYRFIGVHFKSKRPIEEADQEEMRVNEARLLRRHVDAILREDPQARLIVYGDFNDTRPTRAFKTVTGSYNSPDYLTALPAKDSRGHAWTHHWAPHDIYSRIDFVTVSRALRQELDFKASCLIDDPEWDQASDHRPILAVFR